MDINSADSARQWLKVWGNVPRPGILQSVIDGMLICIAVTDQGKNPDLYRGYKEALAVLEKVDSLS